MLYELLCEASWRVVGHVMHGILEVEDQDQYPIPKDTLGQVKMLLETNLVLSQKFNDMRRAYLRELSVYRDKTRYIDETKLAAINSLQEDPVMFYEPLEFVLDETTKQFVYEVIEERLKLGMKVQPKPKVVQEETVVMEDDPEKARLATELRQMRMQCARDQALADKFKEESKRAKAGLMQFETQISDRDAIIAELRAELERLATEGTLRHDVIVAEPETAPEDSTTSDQEPGRVATTTTMDQTTREGNDDELERLRARIRRMEQEKKKQDTEMAELRHQLDASDESPTTSRTKSKNKVTQEAVKKTKAEKREGSSSEVDDDLKNQLAEAMRAEKELRAANKSLEKALDEAKEKAKYRGPSGEKKDLDGEIAKAIEKITEEHKKQLQAKDAEIEKLRSQLEKGVKTRTKMSEEEEAEARAAREREEALEHGHDRKAKKGHDSSGDGDGGEKAREWKRKHDELQDKFDELENEYDKAQQQIRLLLEKVKKYGGEEAVAEVMAEAKIMSIPPRKKRRKKAWERLYEDAQRRILDMQMRRRHLEQQEKKLLISAASRVTDRKGLRQVENLTHLHKAAIATTHRFQDALKHFHSQYAHSPIPEEGMEDTYTSDDDGSFFNTTLSGGFPFAGVPSSPTAADEGSKRVNSRGGKTEGGSELGSDIPMVVAEEFQRLRNENRLLFQELNRVRALLPNSAPVGAGMDANFLGVSTTPIANRDRLKRAETGFSMSGTTSIAAVPVSMGTGNLGGSLRLVQRALSRGNSPEARGKLDLDGSPSSRLSAVLLDTTGIVNLTLGGSNSAAARLPSPTAAATSAPTAANPPANAASKTAPAPWHQTALVGANHTGSKVGPTFSRSASTSQLGNSPQLPWRKSDVSPPTPPLPATAMLPPNGWNASTLSMDSSPNVPGRVPTAPALEPLGRRPSVPPEQLADGATFIPRLSSVVLSPSASAPALAAGHSTSISTTVASPSAASPGQASTQGSFGFGGDLRATGTAFGAGRLQRISGPPALSTEDRPKPSNFLSGPVKPKAAGLCVTALRSQQQLKSSSLPA